MLKMKQRYALCSFKNARGYKFAYETNFRRCIYTQIKEDLNLPVGKTGISLIDLHDFQRIASTVRSKPPCQTLYSGACPAK
ncbi:MAG: hypothetical protein KF734_13970 [Saprospiraceae bacterium]|nr:hypothetical protein [Saprospiraceae bacterium]